MAFSLHPKIKKTKSNDVMLHFVDGSNVIAAGKISEDGKWFNGDTQVMYPEESHTIHVPISGITYIEEME